MAAAVLAALIAVALVGCSTHAQRVRDARHAYFTNDLTAADLRCWPSQKASDLASAIVWSSIARWSRWPKARRPTRKLFCEMCGIA